MALFSACPPEDFALPEFPDLIKITKISTIENSLFLSLGIGILKKMLQFKAKPNLSNALKASFDQLLSESSRIIPYANLVQENDIFNRVYDILLNNPDRITTLQWLESYISPQNANVSDALAKIIKAISWNFLITKNYSINKLEELDSLNSDQISIIFQEFSNNLGIYINVLWPGGNRLFERPNQEIGCIIYLYVLSNGAYGLLEHRAEIELSENPSQLIEINYEPFVYPNIIKGFAIPDEICNPILMNFISVMASKIVENKLYSKDIQDALNNVKELFPQFGYAPKLNEMSMIEPFCEKHKNNEIIQLACKGKHCQECIFDIIIYEYSPENFRVYCSCRNQIAPKDITEIKKTK